MSDKTKIEWTDATWNPVTGCSKVSPGCKHCYAERDWARLVHMPAFAGRAFTDVACHPERLDQPLRWKKPRRVFVNSMSDLFHESVPVEFIAQLFDVMARCPQHTFQILTKRPARMQFLLRSEWDRKPLPNVWLGVSIEDQATADERIPLLLQTPAAVRWVSAEPLLGPVDLYWLWSKQVKRHGLGQPLPVGMYAKLNWVVVGGESGPRARPMHPQWARDLRDQCAAAGVPFLFKQWGEWFPSSFGQGGSQFGAWRGDVFMPRWGDIYTKDNNMVRAGKRAFGARLLDGVQHDAYPGSATW